MTERDAEATRQRLICAAYAEFAQRGIAGARVDRIAAAAKANKAQIYHYFGSKDRLFDAVWETLEERVIGSAQFDAEDLAGFAAHVVDTYARDPGIVRLITWQRLERGDDPAGRATIRTLQSYIDAIATAQAQGRVSDRFEAPVLFALILHLAKMWAMSTRDVLAVVKVGGNRRREEIIRSAVESFLA